MRKYILFGLSQERNHMRLTMMAALLLLPLVVSANVPDYKPIVMQGRVHKEKAPMQQTDPKPSRASVTNDAIVVSVPLRKRAVQKKTEWFPEANSPSSRLDRPKWPERRGLIIFERRF